MVIILRERESASRGSETDKLTYIYTWIHGYWERGRVLLGGQKQTN